MSVYLKAVMLLNFLVDFLLLLGTNRLCGCLPRAGRAALAAGLGGLYTGVCMLPGFSFLGNFFWRLVSLTIMSCIAYGFAKSAFRRGAVFALLSMSISGVVMGLGGGLLALVLAAGAICVLCVFGLQGKLSGNRYIPVELSYGGRQLHLTALHDTGNTLRDPITGAAVLVVGAESAQVLTGLSLQQLRSPLESIGALPGLRLIPYKAVGTSGGLLLALKLKNVKIGNWKGSSIVAFAPENLGVNGKYQALTGGMV